MAKLSLPVATAATPAAKRVGRRLPVKFFYGIGSIAFGVKDNGFQVLLLLFYNQALGLDARLAGLAIMIALAVDACVDPTIGYFSDRLRSRWGRRHPFMYAAALPVSLSYLLLFSPPAGLGQGALFAYLLAVAVLVRMLISVYEIPSSALVAELTTNYDERTSFLSYRYFFGWIGGLSMSVLAFSVFLQTDAAHSVAYLNVIGYRHYGIAAALIMLASILISSLGTQSAVPLIEREAYGEPAPRRMMVEIWSVTGNQSAVAATAAGMLLMLATGLSFALGTYFNIYAWGLTAEQIAVLTASSFISATVALFVTPWLARRFDKRSAAIGVTVTLIALLPAPLVISLFGVMPRQPSLLMPTLFAFNVVVTSLFIVAPTLLSSMLADVAEEIEVHTGRRDEGVIFALNIFMAKCASGVGVFASTGILAFARFPAHARAGAVDPAVITRLAAIYIVSVVSLYIGTVICIGFYHITRERHLGHLRLLAERRAGTVQQALPQGQAQDPQARQDWGDSAPPDPGFYKCRGLGGAAQSCLACLFQA